VFVNHGSHRIGVNITPIVVHQYIAEPADFAPRDHGLFRLQTVGQLLRRLPQGLQIAQGGIVKNLILGQIAPGLYDANALDGIKNVLSVGLLGLTHSSTASRKMFSRM
jgi:hypothetical protein